MSFEGASYEDMSPLTSYVSLLSAHLGSVSALQRSVVGHVLAEWAQKASEQAGDLVGSDGARTSRRQAELCSFFNCSGNPRLIGI
ncbi:hypothetical protein FJT64_025371 [Amphibalanus amphitrite]|uniref:Uncharacterized protein n=1 Tax=Amphibalanus amphitrite TaxID=1232801 RepID=A0A6A4WFB3_AMPAM|nr:hypothetical protein FJT64_025371 [Amphibalanus amphitrite]